MRLEFKKCIPAMNDSIPALLQYVTENIGPHLGGENILTDCLLAIDEAVTNVIMHAYSGKGNSVVITEKHPVVEITFILKDNTLQINITDYGVKYEPEMVPQPDVRENLQGKRKGGFGIFLIKKLMDNFEYRNNNGKNFLSLTKNLDK